jgi:catechol 2,3-dioxygenase-like lactoylglutathione lyase family enzyme
MKTARSSACSDFPAAAVAEPVASIRYLVIDCLDLDRSADFWGPLLGLAPGRRLDNYLFMGSVLPGCDLVLQEVDCVTAGKSPVHFDIQGSDVDDFDMILARTVRLGGRIVETVVEDEYELTVMADPDGNEFCLNRIPSPGFVAAAGYAVGGV